MSAATASDSNHEPSQEEDDNLFRATGFRYSPASERGFPFPWCAKRSKKGWVVRDSPPPPSRTLPDKGVEFKGWKAASKMLQGREVLLKRMESRGFSTAVQAVDNPPKKRPTKQSTAMAAVDNWFRNTQQAAKNQQKEAEDAQFDTFLQHRKKEYRQEVKDRQKQQKMERKRKREEAKLAKEKAAAEQTSARMKPSAATASPLLMSPSRKKHKAAVPQRNRQMNSVILGEDPLLDDMIEDIVLGITDNPLEGSGFTFDNSAVQALREAAMDNARETLMAKQNESPISKKGTEEQPQKESVAETRIDGMIQRIIGEVGEDCGLQFDGTAVDALKSAVKEIAK